MAKKLKLILTLICAIMLCGFAVACNSPQVNDSDVITVNYIVDGDLYHTDSGYVRRLEFPKEPSLYGYTFDGWFTDENVWTEKFTPTSLFNYKYKGTVNVYAKFNIETYSITYDVDTTFALPLEDGVNPQTYTTAQNLPLVDPQVVDNTVSFIGWFDQAGLFVDNLQGLSGDKVLTARFTTTKPQYQRTQGEDVIYMGSYPQSEVKDISLLNSLNSILGTARPNNSNLYNWVIEQCYDNCISSKIIYYKDVAFGGEKYRAVYYKKYRSNNAQQAGSDVNSAQDENGYPICTGTQVYWFKFEPIKWNVVKEEDGTALLLSEKIIAARELSTGSWSSFFYPAPSGLPQNIDGQYWGWFYATLRFWLNDQFYNEAFNVVQRENYMFCTVTHNDDQSTQLPTITSTSRRKTYNKIFLLSREEIGDTITDRSINTAEKKVFTDATRARGYTDYALMQGLQLEDDYTTARYWLRSAGNANGQKVQYVTKNGDFLEEVCTATSIGVVPAMWIKL